MSIELSSKVTISSDVLFQEVSGEMVLLDLNSESYFGLDAIGTRIWKLIEGTGDLQFAFDTILDEYEVEETRLKEDFCELLAQLTESGLVSVVSPPGADTA